MSRSARQHSANQFPHRAQALSRSLSSEPRCITCEDDQPPPSGPREPEDRRSPPAPPFRKRPPPSSQPVRRTPPPSARDSTRAKTGAAFRAQIDFNFWSAACGRGADRRRLSPPQA